MTYQPSPETEKVLVELEKSYKDHNFEKIPDILSYLTYIAEEINKETGEKQYFRKRLTPIAKELYRIIKKFAGTSICWANTETLAWEVNCSAGAITNAKRELTQSFEQLEGKPLINIEEIRVPSFDENKKQINTKPKHKIKVTNIWPYNNGLMQYQSKIEWPHEGELTKEEAEIAIEKIKQSYEQKNVHNQGAYSFYKYASKADSSHEKAPQKADSPHERIHTTFNHTLDNVITYPLATPRQNAFLNKKFEECLRNDQQAFSFLVDFGIQEGMARKIMQTNSYQEVICAFNYLKNQKVRTTYEGYLVKILLQQLWRKA